MNVRKKTIKIKYKCKQINVDFVSIPFMFSHMYLIFLFYIILNIYLFITIFFILFYIYLHIFFQICLFLYLISFIHLQMFNFLNNYLFKNVFPDLIVYLFIARDDPPYLSSVLLVMVPLFFCFFCVCVFASHLSSHAQVGCGRCSLVLS